ncbi:MAG: chorismate synthase [Brevibacterium aurantiacum]|uniref:Chorismate synthase n=2 Tax=Brevibacterium aurantiacum TaxID=273384 RepID=A0A1D7W4L7_BREAU|nr:MULTISPECIES: chorismate synthase [Brevibacterium]MDN5549102.1 chorismate synthase [Brevibacterium sp.]AOP53914.1 Chorismate synthase [Brevibacterium aurantiacum]AZL06023.1 chorismate synthase [Brevibacterium aurantiacum]AZL09584.1 chorismate synthase [Brevibacterium aurantiacum]AZL13219.1 chorismate synthase [Brevibacterium aurantiacum]
MLRWLTAGESHGEALTGIIEGLPAHVPITREDIRARLARRRLGYGRGARMKFEADEVRLLGGVRHGQTLGSPVAVEVGNTEWPKWESVMSPDPIDEDELAGQARNAPLTRPRPGHADIVGMQKYGFDEARPILERASARETAMRVALGTIAANFLGELGITLVSHTVAIGTAAESTEATSEPALPLASDVDALDADPVRCFDPELSARMVAEIDAAKKAGDTLGGVVEVLAYNLPPGLGSHVHWDRRLDSRLAGALMGIQAIKGVEVGDGFLTTRRPGSAAHDELAVGDDGIRRVSNRAGGTEGGMSTGGPLRVRAGMKPIATVPRALATVDVVTGEPAKANHQRSDVCAVPASGVVAEAMVALVLAEAVVEKFGGDSVAETKRNLDAYVAAIPENLRIGQ